MLKIALADMGAVRIVGPRTPPDFLDGGFPVISVRVIGGASLPDKITDVPRMSVLTYHDHYDGSRDLAEDIRQRLISDAIFTEAGRIDRCEVEVRPIEVPYPDVNIRVMSAVYRLSVRR